MPEKKALQQKIKDIYSKMDADPIAPQYKKTIVHNLVDAAQGLGYRSRSYTVDDIKSSSQYSKAKPEDIAKAKAT